MGPRQILLVQMGVNLGGADVRMTEQLLYAPKVRAAAQKMGGE